MTVSPVCPPDGTISNADSFVAYLRELALTHTLRQALKILADEANTVMTYAALQRAAHRHDIHFQPAPKGGPRPHSGGPRSGSGRPRGARRHDRNECSWIAGDYAAGGAAGDSADGMPPVPVQAAKRSGMAVFDTGWVLQAGGRLGRAHSKRPDGAGRVAGRRARPGDIASGVQYSGLRRS